MFGVGEVEGLEFGEGGDLFELAAQFFGARNIFGEGLEAWAHPIDGIPWILIAVAEEILAVAEHDLPPFVEGRRRDCLAGAQGVLDFAEEERIPEGGAADHEAADGVGLAETEDIACPGDAAIADDGNGEGLGDGEDGIPIGLAAVALFLGTAMDGEGFDACFEQALGNLYGIDGCGIPADADFGGDGNAPADALDGSGGDILKELRLAQEGGTGAIVDDLGGGAAVVDIDKIRLEAIGDAVGGLGDFVGVAAEQLDSHGALGVGKIDGPVGIGLAAGIEEFFGADEFGDHDIGPVFLAELAEGAVGEAGHGGEVEGRIGSVQKRQAPLEGAGGRLLAGVVGDHGNEGQVRAFRAGRAMR